MRVFGRHGVLLSTVSHVLPGLRDEPKTTAQGSSNACVFFSKRQTKGVLLWKGRVLLEAGSNRTKGGGEYGRREEKEAQGSAVPWVPRLYTPFSRHESQLRLLYHA
jgi:hypothetical protein